LVEFVQIRLWNLDLITTKIAGGHEFYVQLLFCGTVDFVDDDLGIDR
jgi:hypothetical protein